VLYESYLYLFDFYGGGWLLGCFHRPPIRVSSWFACCERLLQLLWLGWFGGVGRTYPRVSGIYLPWLWGCFCYVLDASCSFFFVVCVFCV